MGLQVVVYALFLRRDWHSLFSTTGKGLVSRELGEAMVSFDSPLIPKLGWLVAFGRHLGLGEETVLSIAWACLLCMGCCLLVGLFCRAAAMSGHANGGSRGALMHACRLRYRLTVTWVPQGTTGNVSEDSNKKTRPARHW